MEVVLLLEMEEEMEGRIMVEFVVKMKGKWWRNGWPRREAKLFWAVVGFSVGGCKMKKKKRMKEREGVEVYIMGKIII